MDQQLPQEPQQIQVSQPMARRRFLTLTGISALAVAFAQTACKKEELNTSELTGVNLGKDDTGLLNYAYAIEQTNTYFIQLLTSSYFAGASDYEKKYLENIRYHQETYKAFYRESLGSTAISELDISFDGNVFSDRSKALSQLFAFADWSVAAYNGMAMLFEQASNLLTCSKIASVHARHSAEIREWLAAGSYAGASVVNSQGLDLAKSPTEVLNYYGQFIKTPLNSTQLPVS